MWGRLRIEMILTINLIDNEKDIKAFKLIRGVRAGDEGHVKSANLMKLKIFPIAISNGCFKVLNL